MAAIADWTAEKNASIDWGNPEEILLHRFTLLSMLPYHPKLEKKLNIYSDHEVRSELVQLFTNKKRIEEQKSTLKKWFDEGLLTPRKERWCRKCGKQGHTMLTCGYIVEKADNERRYQEHMSVLERARIKADQDRKAQERAAKAESRRDRAKPGVAAAMQAAQGTAAGNAPITREEWLRGNIKTVDYNIGKGEIVQERTHESYAFFIDRTEYGLKKIREKDDVRFHVEWYNMRPMAVDVTPMMSRLSDDDISSFLHTCETSTDPIRLQRVILTQRQEFPNFLKAIASNPTAATNATYVIVRLTTFSLNRRAIHSKVLGAFLSLLCDGANGKQHVPGNFFPSMVARVLPQSATDGVAAMSGDPLYIDNLMDIAELCFMMYLHTKIEKDALSAVTEPLRAILEGCADATSPSSVEHRKAKKALVFLSSADADWLKTAVIPGASDFAVPAMCGNSIFNPKNLPVNCGREPYPNTQAYVRAQCELLRADQFTACSQLFIAGTGVEVEGFEIDEHIAKDVEHARFFNRVRYMGRTIARDFDQVNCYMFEAKIWKGKHQWAWALERGALVAIYTGNASGAANKAFDPSRLFWGLTTDADPQLISHGIFALHPCENNDFEKLTTQLAEMEKNEELDRVIMMETSVFFHGYSPVMGALSQFLGPKPMELPIEDIIVSEKDKRPAGQQVGYLPDYCVPAFEAIVNDIRGKLVLDKGQDAAMKGMSTSPMMLVQGPPGTGKSFIGCRIVEAFVRYKQQLANGDILANIDIEKLPHSDLNKLTPNLGPVVVITYKNHALDEFLIDLKKSGLWDIKNTGQANPRFPGGCSMVRIGGGSAEPELQGYMIGDIMSAKAQAKDVAQARGRVGVLTKRVERMANEIMQLLKGRVPPALLNSWLTDEQRTSFIPTNLQEWLDGGRYTGKSDEAPVERRYTSLLGGELIEKLALPMTATAEALLQQKEAKSANENEDDAGQLSAMAKMKKEMESTLQSSSKSSVGPNGEVKSRIRPGIVPKEAMDLLNNPPVKPAAVPDNLQSLWSLAPQTRHDYLAYLLQTAILARVREYNVQITRLETALTVLRHADDEAKLDLLRSADVVGLTTTGCAMNQNILRSLEPSVLVVEEAAEVLESQLLACMTSSLKQIVLIGDHYQLQPKVDTLALEKFNKMNISMFERLVRRMEPIMLVEQRRMKPAISRLVRPFYKADTLGDHPSVVDRPFVDSLGRPHVGPVPGLLKDVFFWRHHVAETEATRGLSKVNVAEATMATSLASHLLSEGVRPSSICIITPYLGQHRLLRTELQEAGKLCAEVRVSTVDRFQGDEADVIILSLVRTERLTDFLKLRNRMIVSCSRARHAMVILGNDELLHKSPHWHKVLGMLEEEGLVGDKLPIRTRFGELEIPANTPYDEWHTHKRGRNDAPTANEMDETTPNGVEEKDIDNEDDGGDNAGRDGKKKKSEA